MRRWLDCALLLALVVSILSPACDGCCCITTMPNSLGDAHSESTGYTSMRGGVTVAWTECFQFNLSLRLFFVVC